MSEQIKVYPNPFYSYANIEFTLSKQSNVLIEVYNVVGEKINVITKGIQMSGSYKYKFSANELGYSEGIYYIKFFINGTSFTEKLVQLH